MNIVTPFSFCFLLVCLYMPDCSVAQDDDDNYQEKSQLQQVLNVWNAILHLTQQRLQTTNPTHVPANQESKAVQSITEQSVTLQNTSETASFNTINGKSMTDKHVVSDNKQITDGGTILKTNNNDLEPHKTLRSMQHNSTELVQQGNSTRTEKVQTTRNASTYTTDTERVSQANGKAILLNTLQSESRNTKEQSTSSKSPLSTNSHKEHKFSLKDVQSVDGGFAKKQSPDATHINQVKINLISSTDPQSADQSVQQNRLLHNENDSMHANFRFEDLSQERSRISVNKTNENVSNVTDQAVVDTTMKITKDSSSNNQYSATVIQPLRFGAKSDKETKGENKILLPTDTFTATDNRNLQPIELDKQGASITKGFSWIGIKEPGITTGKVNEKKSDINASSRDITPMISKEQTSEVPSVPNMTIQNTSSVILNTVENSRLNSENMHNSQTVTAKILVDTGSIKSQESFSAKTDTQSASQSVLPTDKESFSTGHVNSDTQVTDSVFKADKDMKNMQSSDTVHVVNKPIVSKNNPSTSVITGHTSTLLEPLNMNAVYVKVSENLVKERGFVTDNPTIIYQQEAVENKSSSITQHDQSINSLVQSDISQTNKVDIIAGNTFGDAATSSGIIDISPAAEIIESSINLSAPSPPPTVDQPIRTNDPNDRITDKNTNLQVHTNKRNESQSDGKSFSQGVVVVPELKSDNTESNKEAGFVHINMTTDPLQNFGTYEQKTAKLEKPPDSKVTSTPDLFIPGYDTKGPFVNTNSSQLLASNGSNKKPFASLIETNGKFTPNNVFSGGKSHKEAVKDVLNEKPQINDTLSSNNDTYTNILEKTRMVDSKQTEGKNIKKWTTTFRNSKTEGGNRKQTFSFMSNPPVVKMLSSENIQSPDNTATAKNTPETEYKVALHAPVIPDVPTKTDSQDKKQSNGMTQSITNFENNRLLYNEFRKFKMSGKYRRKRSILSAPAFMYQLMDKPVKVFSNSIDAVLEHPENSYKKAPASLKLNFRTDKDNVLTNSKIHQGHVSLKIVNELLKSDKVSKNKKNKAMNRHEEMLQLHEIKPLRHKKRKSHKKRDTNDKIVLVNRISKTLSNGLPVFSTRRNKLKGTQEGKKVVSNTYKNKQKGIEISAKDKSLQQQISDVGEYTTNVHENADSKFENTFSNHQGSFFKQKPTHVDALMKEPVSQSETHPSPDKKYNAISRNMDQISDISYNNLNYVEQNLIEKHDLVSTPSINTDSSRSSLDMLDNDFSSTAATPFNVSASDIEANISTQKIPFQLSDELTTGLSSVTSYEPQTVVNMSNLVSGLSNISDLVITNDTPSYYNTMPIALSPRFPSNSKNVFIDQFQKTLTSDVSNVKTSMVAGGCIIDGKYYRFEDMPSSIQGCHEAQTKPDHLKLAISETKPVPNDYTDNRGFISQGFVTKFPVLEVIRGNDDRPFAIKLPGDMQGYDIIIDPRLNDGSVELAVLHANNQKGNDLVVSEKNSGDSRAELNLKQDFGMYGDIDNNYVFKWSDGISDKAGTGLASLPDYNLGSEVRVGSSLSMGHALFLDKESNDIKNADSIGYDLAFQNGGTIDVLDLQSHKTKGHNYVYQSLFNRIPSPIFVSSKANGNQQSNNVKIDSKIPPKSMVTTPSPANLSQDDGNKHHIDIAENNVGELSYHQSLTENNIKNNHIYSNYNGVYLARNDDLLQEKMRTTYQPSYTPNNYKTLSEKLKDPMKSSVIQPSQLKGSFISKMNLEAEMPKDFSDLKFNLIGDSFSNSLIAKQRRSSGMIPTSIPMKLSEQYKLDTIMNSPLRSSRDKHQHYTKVMG